MTDNWAVPSESMQWIYLWTGRRNGGEKNEWSPINTQGSMNERK